jgi:hypothetical protein
MLRRDVADLFILSKACMNVISASKDFFYGDVLLSMIKLFYNEIIKIGTTYEKI